MPRSSGWSESSWGVLVYKESPKRGLMGILSSLGTGRADPLQVILQTQLNRLSNLALSFLPIMNIKVSLSRQSFPAWCWCG